MVMLYILGNEFYNRRIKIILIKEVFEKLRFNEDRIAIFRMIFGEFKRKLFTQTFLVIFRRILVNFLRKHF